MLNTREQNTQSNQQVYEIRLEGHLDESWTNWFGGSCIKENDNDDTLLTCTVMDQSALFGLLRKVRDLGVPLLSVTRVKPDQKQLNIKEIQQFEGNRK